MTILQKIKNSIYNPAFYSATAQDTARSAIRYFLVLALLFSAVYTVAFTIYKYPTVKKIFSKESIDKVVNFYPKDLEIKISKGQASSNIDKEPYFVKMPAEISQAQGEKKSPANLLVINTKGDPSLEEIYKYDSVIVLTKNNIISQNANGQLEIRKLENMPDVVINRDNILKWSEKLAPYLKIMAPGIVVMDFVINYIMYIAMLVYFLLAALFVMLIGRIKRVKLKFREAYKISIYASTLALFIQFLWTATGSSMPAFLFTAILLLIAALNIDERFFVITKPEEVV